MDQLSIQKERVTLADGREQEVVDLLINGKCLSEITGYGTDLLCGLPKEIILLPSRHLLGQPHADYYKPDTNQAVLNQDRQTLTVKDNSIVAEIVENDDIIIWKNFQLFHPGFSAFISSHLSNPTLTFSKAQYHFVLDPKKVTQDEEQRAVTMKFRGNNISFHMDDHMNTEEIDGLVSLLLEKMEKRWEKIEKIILDSLYKIYCEAWKGSDEGCVACTENEFLAHIQLTDVNIYEIDCLEFIFEDGGLFRGHAVIISWDLKTDRLCGAELFG